MVNIASLNWLPEDAAWPARIPRLEDGWWPTGGEVDPENDNGLMNWQAQLLAARTARLKEGVDGLSDTSVINVTVGAAGDYPTINAALTALSKRRRSYVRGGAVATIRLLNGFVMAEQVLIEGINLGWITIISDAAEVVVDRAALNVLFNGYYPLWGGINGAVLPQIGVLLNMTASGPAAERHGIYLIGGSSGRVAHGAGIKNSGGHGAAIGSGAVLLAGGAVFSGNAGNGIQADGGATVNVVTATITNNGNIGVYSANTSTVSAGGAVATGNVGGGALASNGSRISVANCNCRTGASDASTDIRVAGGSFIAAGGAIGGLNQTANTLTTSGIISR